MNDFKSNIKHHQQGENIETQNKPGRGGGAEHRFFHRFGQSGGDGWYRHQLLGGCGTNSQQIRNICLVQMV